MRERKHWLLSFLIISCVLCGCSVQRELKPGEQFICYLTMEGTGIEKKAFDWSGGNVEKEVQNILDALCEPDESGKFRAAIPENVEVQSVNIENRKIDIHFSKGYRKLESAQEVLCRAAVVQSLTQVKDIELVKFYIENEPILSKTGAEIGYMSAEDFVQNTGETLGSVQQVEVSLWIPNKEGDALINEVRNVRHNNNIPVEKLVIEQLMTKKSIANELIIMPPETKLLGVTVKDGICYVNFDEGFQISGYTINPELTIAAIVDSIVSNSTASQVQISINGKTDVKFQNTVDLSKPLTKSNGYVEVE